jgi:hypothetical protein
MIEITLPDPEVVLAAGDHAVLVRHFFLVQRRMHALTDAK